MQRALFSILLTALATPPSIAATPPELFAKAKEQFRLGSYTSALATLQKLEEETQKPEYERDRSALLPAMVFYRGASYASLGRTAEARGEFEVFLTYQPDVSLDPAVYPKKVIAALEEARRALQRKSQTPEETATSIAQAYRAFQAAMKPDETSEGEDWADGPVRVLLTADQRRDFERLLDAVARSEFVIGFWKSRDPKPETPRNEFRDEFEKLVAFSDARFTQDEVRGSLTDRGMVFILLGPPTYVGRKPLQTGEDANDPAGLKLFRTSDVRTASVPGGSRSDQVARVDRVTGPGTKINEAASNWREVWHYRRENLPKSVPYLQVDFDFVTKAGYGKNVLQRDTQVLDTLEKAKAGLRQPKA